MLRPEIQIALPQLLANTRSLGELLPSFLGGPSYIYLESSNKGCESCTVASPWPNGFSLFCFLLLLSAVIDIDIGIGTGSGPAIAGGLGATAAPLIALL